MYATVKHVHYLAATGRFTLKPQIYAPAKVHAIFSIQTVKFCPSSMMMCPCEDLAQWLFFCLFVFVLDSWSATIYISGKVDHLSPNKKNPPPESDLGMGM